MTSARSRAAEAGSSEAQVEFGTAWYLGRGRPRDSARAAHWFREAAKAGARALTLGEQFKLARAGSFRVWSPQQRHRLRQLQAEQEMEKKERELRWQQRLAEVKERAA